MTSALAPLAQGCLPPSGLGELAVPSPLMAEGEHAATRYVEFFPHDGENRGADAGLRSGLPG